MNEKEIIITCPYCHCQSTGTALAYGRRVECGHCGNKFIAGQISSSIKRSIESAHKRGYFVKVQQSKSKSKMKFNDGFLKGHHLIVCSLVFLLRSPVYIINFFKLSSKIGRGRLDYGMALFCHWFWYTALILFILHSDGTTPPPGAIISIVLTVLSFCQLVFMAAKRFHDGNLSGWWVVLIFGGVMALLLPNISSCHAKSGFASIAVVSLVLLPCVPLLIPSVKAGNRYGTSKDMRLLDCRPIEYFIGIIAWVMALSPLVFGVEIDRSSNLPDRQPQEKMATIDYSKMTNAEFHKLMMKKKQSTIAYLQGKLEAQNDFRERAKCHHYYFYDAQYDDNNVLLNVYVSYAGSSATLRGEIRRGLDHNTLVYPTWIPNGEAEIIWKELEIDWTAKIREAEIEYDERMMVLRDDTGKLVDRDKIRQEIKEERFRASPEDIIINLRPASE